jgi:hypothetical protein
MGGHRMNDKLLLLHTGGADSMLCLCNKLRVSRMLLG